MKLRISRQTWLSLLSLLVTVAVWMWLARVYPSYIVPSPAKVWAKWWQLSRDGRIAVHLWATLSPTLVGFVLATGLAFGLGYLAAQFKWLRELAWPLTVVMQTVPIVAMLPLLVIWFGTGASTHTLIIVLVAFFPMYVTALQAFGRRSRALEGWMRTLAAGRVARFWYLELPLALPELFGALKVGFSFALIGEVVAELMMGQQGLGFLINFGRGVLDTALVFAALLTLIGLGLVMQLAFRLLEKYTLNLR